MPLISGVSITLDKEYIVPPLNFGALKRLQPIIESIKAITIAITPEQIDNIAMIVQAAMVRNYPDITTDFLLEWIDMANATTLFSAIMGQSGVKTAGEPTAANIIP